MKISDAVGTEEWAGHMARTVDVGFINRLGKEDETQFDLMRSCRSISDELEALWHNMHDEFDAEEDAITYIRFYDGIVD